MLHAKVRTLRTTLRYIGPVTLTEELLLIQEIQGTPCAFFGPVLLIDGSRNVINGGELHS